MICNHCGKEVESLSSAIAELHDQGLTVMEIRDKLSARIRGDRDRQYTSVYNLLASMGLKPNVRKSKNSQV